VDEEPYFNIRIDGDFNDWEGLVTPMNENILLDASIDIAGVGVENNMQYLAFYVETRDAILEGADGYVDTLFIFIDHDRNAGTGYDIEGIGADNMIMIYGKNSNPLLSILRTFDNSRDRNDWGGWTSGHDAATATKLNKLETQVEWAALDPENEAEKPVDVLFYFQSGGLEDDYADYIVSNEKGVLGVTQESTVNEILTTGSSDLLEISLQAVEDDISVSGLNVTMSGTALGLDVTSVRLMRDDVTLDENQGYLKDISFQLNWRRAHRH
jgi:hypothetical protein